MRLKERFRFYVERHALEIMCTMMYLTGNINLDLLEGVRR